MIFLLSNPFLANFYPRSPCGERPGKPLQLFCLNTFLSTLSLRRATKSDSATVFPLSISIHALLAESDHLQSPYQSPEKSFLSTLSLRRATRMVLHKCADFLKFLSTLSLRRATAKVHKTVGHFCAYETNFMGIASSC